MIGKKSDSKSIRRSAVRRIALLSGIAVLALCTLYVTSYQKETPPRLAVGWQTAWATAGQIVETLVHTNIPKLYGSNATFRNFLFGPDMLEAALGGNIDATSVGIVPAINLLAASDDWVIVCRLIDFSVSTIARTGTGITAFADLKGRKLGVPFGSGAHPYVVQRLDENNLHVGTGLDAVELINVSPAEGAVSLQQGGVDALGTWEPNATIIESKGLGRSIDDKRYIGVMVVRKSLVEKTPEQVMAFIKSLIEANLYVAKNRQQTDEWFATRSSFDRALLKQIRIIEPNLNANSIEEISIDLKPEDMAECQQVADKMFESGLIKRKVILNERVNLKLAKQAMYEVLRDGSKARLVNLGE